MPSRNPPSPSLKGALKDQHRSIFSTPLSMPTPCNSHNQQLPAAPYSKRSVALCLLPSDTNMASSESSTSSSSPTSGLSAPSSPTSSSMAPSTIFDEACPESLGTSSAFGAMRSDYLLDRNIKRDYPIVKRGEGCYLELADGRKVFDASAGAAVSSIGHGNSKVVESMIRVLMVGTPYLATTFWAHNEVEELCKEIIDGTDRKMSRVYLTGSGSEAMESTIKLSRQYFYELDKNSPRVNFITRNTSYHGNTIGALAMSGFVARRAPYEPFLMSNVHHISSCHPYRQRLAGESDEHFVAKKSAELEAKFQELGPETVIGFVCEPVVGAALGCVASPPGYLQAMRDVCHKHGALFILDEVMSGMGRCGTLHAWQAEDVVPDIQTTAKGLGGGYAPIGAVLINKKVVDRLVDGTGQFIHGQTYQAMPLQAAAALAVQRVIKEDNLLENCRKQGEYLGKRLQNSLGKHPHVGDIRGRGLFWGLEFVKDKETKEPFNHKLSISASISELALSSPFNMSLYPGQGSADGVNGDHILICPPYIVTGDQIDLIVDTVTETITQFFAKLSKF